MTTTEIRQSFLDFFKSKGHTIVPGSSLLPDSPNLLFTNAGMNQFVPIFLGQRKPDVSKWPGVIPGLDTRAANTQKCIRAGGKHNDLEDVGLDTYHHTFFEMLGNWSFGDYFKREAIQWAWELVVEKWKFPPERLYATVYKPGPGDPSEFDQEAYDVWFRIFRTAGLDPTVHIKFGGVKDNFWMMGETGPCGPCTEIHVDLTPNGDSAGKLVNTGSTQCIEIWNLVFIQFNAEADGTLSPLSARHVDTGMGLERVAAIVQGTNGLKDFVNARISNYETDLFRPLFTTLERLSGKRYAGTVPTSQTELANVNSQVAIDVAFRVIADHIRALGFAIADGILPSNEGRGYVLRRILRRAVRYGRTLGFREPFFYKLIDILADTMGDVFPEIRTRKNHVKDVIRFEEQAFNRTLDRGIALFEEQVANLLSSRTVTKDSQSCCTVELSETAAHNSPNSSAAPVVGRLSGELAFKLYDTYGFPLDLTQLMARERGLTVDVEEFNRLMEQQRARARAAQKRTVIELTQIETATPTKFVGYETLQTTATVLDVVNCKDKTAVVLDVSPCYAEMGGQVGDTGELQHGSQIWRIIDTQRVGDTWLHFIAVDQASNKSILTLNRSNTDTGSGHGFDIDPGILPTSGSVVTVSVDRERREAVQRHHTVTHLLHWALHEVVSRDIAQKGSLVAPDKLTFDFNSPPLTQQQLAEIEQLVNERIVENAPVSWTEVPYADVRGRPDIRQFFGEKYGATVRVVQIGGTPGALDGYSMELCGGTHCRATGQIGLFKILSESAIAAGVRRIEAVAGLEAYRRVQTELALIKSLADKVNSPPNELERKIENLLEQLKLLEKQVKLLKQKQAVETAKRLLSKAITLNNIPVIIERIDEDAHTLQCIANELKGQFNGAVILGGVTNGAVALVASVSPEFTSRIHAGKIIQELASIVGGKGGGKPDNARGGGRDISKLDAALASAKSLF